MIVCDPRISDYNVRTRLLQQMITQNLNVSDKMDPWISQMGFPVVRVTKIQGAAGYLVTQERFLIGSEADTDPRYKDTPYKYEL